MKLKEKVKINKAVTTSREFLSNIDGIKCVHYGDIYKNYSGKSIKSSQIINGFINEVPVDKILNCDSIIVPDVTETVSDWGHFTYIEYDGTPYINGTHTFAITSDSSKELRYIFRYLSSNKTRLKLQTLLNGSTVFQISLKNFEDYVLTDYHFEESQQLHIVDILGSIDEKIENNDILSKELLQLGLNLFQQIYKENRFYIKRLLDCVSLLKDGTHNPPQRIEKGIPLLTGQNIENGFINHDKITFISYDDYRKIHSRYAPVENDLVITKIGTLGKVAILRSIDLPMAIHCNSALLRFSELSNIIAFFLLQTDDFQEELNKHKNRTVQEFINLQQLGDLELKIPVTTNTEMETLISLSNRLSMINIENKKLNELKQLYLKKFFG